MRPNMTKKTSIAAVAVLAALALPMVAGAENKLKVQDGSGVDKFVVTDQGYIGIGTNDPKGPMHVISSGTTAASSSSIMEHMATVGDDPLVGQSLAPNFTFIRNNQGAALPRKDDALGFLNFGSIVNNLKKPLAMIYAKADTGWTTTSNPTYISFWTTNTGNVTNEKLRINPFGLVGIGTATPTQRLEVNGGVRMNTVVVRPVCSAAVRGTLWFEQKNTAGVADTMAVCAKGADENYAWRNLIQ